LQRQFKKKMDTEKNSPTSSLPDATEGASSVSENSLTQADEILFHTQKLLYYNKLMTEQCSRWLAKGGGKVNEQ